MNINRIHNPLQTPSPQVQQRPVVPQAEKTFSEHLAQQTTPSPSLDEHQAVLSQSEKEFFEQLYPASAEAVRAYTPFHRNGQREAVRVGSIVDRKG